MRLSRLLTVTLTSRCGPPPPCRCGHVTVAHEHYRRGSDCALCECVRYRRLLGARPATGLTAHAPLARLYAVSPGGARDQPGAA